MTGAIKHPLPVRGAISVQIVGNAGEALPTAGFNIPAAAVRNPEAWMDAVAELRAGLLSVADRMARTHPGAQP